MILEQLDSRVGLLALYSVDIVALTLQTGPLLIVALPLLQVQFPELVPLLLQGLDVELTLHGLVLHQFLLEVLRLLHEALKVAPGPVGEGQQVVLDQLVLLDVGDTVVLLLLVFQGHSASVETLVTLHVTLLQSAPLALDIGVPENLSLLQDLLQVGELLRMGEDGDVLLRQTALHYALGVLSTLNTLDQLFLLTADVEQTDHFVACAL